jgi:probable HAF family extracellular repeat protein
MASFIVTHTMLVAALLILETTAHPQQDASNPAPPAIRLTALGAIYPDESYGYGVNDWGDVVGTSSVRIEPGFVDFHGFLWRQDTGMLDLVARNVPMHFAFDVNFRRQIVGSGWGPALLWTPGGTTEPVTPGSHLAVPSAINDLGQVVGNYVAGNTQRAFSWTADTGFVDLGTLGGMSSRAFGVNNRGQVVGESLTATQERKAFLWTKETAMIDLGGESSSAHGINDRGEIVGTSSGRVALWTAQGILTDLGGLQQHEWSVPGGIAMDINELSQIVGTSGWDNSERAFLWTPSAGMVDLGALGGEPPESQAVRISNRGQVVGWSRSPSSPLPHPYVQAVLWDISLTPAERLASLRALLHQLHLIDRLSAAHLNALTNKIDSAERALARGHSRAVSAHAGALIAHVAALAQAGVLTASESALLSGDAETLR